MLAPNASKISNRTGVSASTGYYSNFPFSVCSNQRPKSPAITEEGDHLNVDDVRITPSSIVFKDAFEGKRFKEKIVIQNCGRNAAFVRMCSPSSMAFKIKTIPYGQYLPPGLSISRNLSYTHPHSSSSPEVYIPIYVNDHFVKYKINFVKPFAKIVADPQCVDFGTVNADMTPTHKTLLLVNEGAKASRFAIDVGLNKLKLIVQPMQGLIQPKGSMTIHVEIVGHEEGSFQQELLIKCETPLRIPVKVKFIVPKIQVSCSNGTLDFTFIDFPITYIGNSHTRFLVIKNHSAVSRMFCVMAEVDREVMTVKEALGKCQDLKYFQISPVEGRLRPYEGRVIEIVFAPKKFPKTPDRKFHDDYALCFIRIIQVNIIDLQEAVSFNGDFKELEMPPIGIPAVDSDSDSLSLSTKSDEGSFSSVRLIKSDTENTTNDSNGYNYRRICLHGEFEKADMKIQPKSISIVDLKVEQQEVRTLVLKNNSKQLHIRFLYKKFASVEIFPKEGILKPLESLEVNVQIKPTKIGEVRGDVVFEILHRNFPENENVVVGNESISIYYNVISVTSLPKSKFNMGITPQITNEVGFLTDDVRFNTPIDKPRATMVSEQKHFKEDDALIAFPNDRPTSLRPWTSKVECKTIFAGIPRPKTNGDAYTLTVSERETKNLLAAHYNEYIRRKKSNRNKPSGDFEEPEYSIGDGHKILMDKWKMKFHCQPIKIESRGPPPFMTMTPMELYQIKVEPYTINIDEIACGSKISKWINIENKNEVSIRIFLECRHSSITFKKDRRFLIGPKSKVAIEIEYEAISIGRYHIKIMVIINETHCCQVTLLSRVVDKYVNISTNSLEFDSDDLKPKHIDVTNPLNIPVGYKWEVPESCFSILPNKGSIEPHMTYTFLVTYTPHPNRSIEIHANLILENNAKVTVSIFVTMKQPDVDLQSNRVFISQIPLNVTVRKRFFIRNNGFEPVSLAVIYPEPALGVKIYNEEVLPGRSTTPIILEFKLGAFVTFSFTINLQIQRFYDFIVKVICEVDFPYLTIEPKELSFSKLTVGCTQFRAFCIENNSNTLTKLTLNFEELPELTLAESDDTLEHSCSVKEFYLDHKQRKKLFLRFTPVDITCYSCLLPYVINDLIGPSSIDNRDTLIPTTFYEDALDVYVDDNEGAPLELFRPMEAIKINARALESLLEYSSLHFYFRYFPNENFVSVTENELMITNIGVGDVAFCFRTDDLDVNYTIVPFSGNDIEQYEFSFASNLVPKASAVFKIFFHPAKPGVYDISLPVYIRHQLEGAPVNYINLHGIYHVASTDTDIKMFYLEPVPLECISSKTIVLKTSYHLPDCFMKFETTSEDIQVDFIDDREAVSRQIHKDLRVVISFKSSVATFRQETLEFSCGCPTHHTIFVRVCSENSLVTIHGFLQAHAEESVDIFPDFSLVQSSATQITEESSTLTCEFSDSSLESPVEVVEVKHAFEDLNHINGTTFPFFPSDDDESEYARYMRRTLSAVENWVYEQCFYCRRHYSIPDGIAATPVIFDIDEEMKKKNKSFGPKKEETIELPFLLLLENIAGSVLEDFIPKGSLPEDPNEKVAFMHTTYSKILNVLLDQEACLLHVSAEYLLEYEDYVEYMKNIWPYQKTLNNVTERQIFDEKTFRSISLQNWIDVLLQLYKLFILPRIEGSLYTNYSPKNKQNSPRTNIDNESFASLFKEAQLPKPNVYGEPVLILLSWLEYNFDKQRKTLWKGTPLEYRRVQHFDKDLKDCLILAAVTASYCPYLAEFFKNFFTKPKSYEEYLFNAIILTDAWSSVNVKFSILPEEIVDPNRIQMLLLVTYLYDFLPGLAPKQTITLMAKHTKFVQETIKIRNANSHKIAHEVVIISSDPQCFEVDKDVLEVPPNREGSISVTFYARKLSQVSATLILCGDTPGYNYAKSIAINLEGVPDVSFVNGTLKIRSSIYQVFDKTFSIFSPYREEAIYDIFYYLGIPEYVDDLKGSLISYQELQQLKLPRMFHNRTNKIECDFHGIALSIATICTMVPARNEFITYFCNNDIGDFSLKVMLIVDRKRTNYETISVRPPRDLSTFVCLCRNEKTQEGLKLKCPRELTINIPRKNKLMWSCLEKMFLAVLDEEDVPFWNKYLGTSAGKHILKHIFESEKEVASQEIMHIFKKKVTYSVVPDKKPRPPATLPASVTIENVLADGTFGIPMHIHSNVLSDFFFNMVSEDEKEIRFYEVEFLPEL